MDASKINTFDRIEADLHDWENALNDIRSLINQGEIGDEDAFTDARKKITGMLGEMEQTREFIAVKRTEAAGATADVESLFVDERPTVEFEHLPENLSSEE